jgi:membrane protein implicated in regulation of membrane protease activity
LIPGLKIEDFSCLAYEKANRQLHHGKYHMNEMQLILFGLIVLGASVVIFYLTDLVPVKIVVISLGSGLLILLADKRQSQDKKSIHNTNLLMKSIK